MRTNKFCSVVFGVTLRILVINTSSSVTRDQQMRRLLLLAMNITNLPRSGGTVFMTRDGRTMTTSDEARHWTKMWMFSYPTCIRRPH